MLNDLIEYPNKEYIVSLVSMDYYANNQTYHSIFDWHSKNPKVLKILPLTLLGIGCKMLAMAFANKQLCKYMKVIKL